MHHDIFVNISAGWVVVVFLCALWINRRPV